MHVVTGTGLQHLYFAMESVHIVLNRSMCFLNVFCSSLAFKATFVFSPPGYIASWIYSQQFIFHIMLQAYSKKMWVFSLKSHNTHNDIVKKCLGFYSDFCKFIKKYKTKTSCVLNYSKLLPWSSKLNSGTPYFQWWFIKCFCSLTGVQLGPKSRRGRVKAGGFSLKNSLFNLKSRQANRDQAKEKWTWLRNGSVLEDNVNSRNNQK